jgi:PAS domain S-box-containing protein
LDQNAVVITDATGVIRFWSGGAERAFGYAADEAVGQTVELIIPDQYRADHWTGFRRAMDVGATSLEGRTIPFPVRQADGAVVAFPGRLTLIRQAEGQVVGAMVVFG